MNSPRVIRASGGICIPELSQEERAAGGIEAAAVGDGCVVMAAKRDIGGTGWEG